MNYYRVNQKKCPDVSNSYNSYKNGPKIKSKITIGIRVPKIGYGAAVNKSLSYFPSEMEAGGREEGFGTSETRLGTSEMRLQTSKMYLMAFQMGLRGW